MVKMYAARNTLVACAGAACILLAGERVAYSEALGNDAAQMASRQDPAGVSSAGAQSPTVTGPGFLVAQDDRKRNVRYQVKKGNVSGENRQAQNGETSYQPPAKPVGTPPDHDPAHQEIAPIFEQRGVLTPRRTLVLEPSVQYINSSSNRVALSGYTIIPALNIGLIDVKDVNSNTYVTSLALRYGLTNRLEFEVKVPYVYRSDTTSTQPADPNQPSTPGSVFTAEGDGIGDVEFGPRYQLNQPEGNGPYFIVGVRAKSNTGKDPFEVRTVSDVTTPGGADIYADLPTGSGFWGLQPSLTTILASDPAVFFGTLSYMWNIERNIPGQGRFDPGDTVEVNLGMGIGLNEKVSFSIGYDHVVLGKTKKDGVDLPGSIVTQVASLLLGCSYKLNDNTNLSFSLGAGLTAAAPNVQVTLRVPVSYLLGK